MKRVKLWHSAPLRVAALFVGLFAVSIVIAFSVLYLKVRSDLDDHQRAYVLDIEKALAAVLAEGGFSSLSVDIGKRVATASDDDTVYFLTNEKDEFVAGNVKFVPRFSNWKFLPWETLEPVGKRRELEPEEGVLGRWTDVLGGHLFVGNSDGDVIEAREMLLEGLGLALAIAISAALLGGTILGMRTRQRIDIISRALDAASGGDLTVRIPHQSPRDELSHIASRINATLDRLQASVTSIRQVTTDIAHDLKSPIGRVRQRLQSASVHAKSTQEYGALVDSTIGEIDKIVETFNALLSISQIEAGLQKQRFTQQSLMPLLATVVDAYTAVAEDAGHQFTSQIGERDDAVVLGDKDLLTQLFANIVENAIRHCSPGAQISIVLDLEPSGPVVKIGDTGPGIPPEERQNVFRRLYRLEKSRTTPGSGLGLSLVAAIADLHDAKVELCDNEPGLLVKLRFPLCAQSPLAIGPMAAAAE